MKNLSCMETLDIYRLPRTTMLSLKTELKTKLVVLYFILTQYEQWEGGRVLL